MAPHVGHRAGRVDVLGVGVDPVTVDGLHAEIARLVRAGKPGLVLNVNAHCLNLCYEDSALRASLNGADVVFCDGAGVMLAARMLGQAPPGRVSPTRPGSGGWPTSPPPRASRSTSSAPDPASRRRPRGG